jgi:hypothetical protein
MVVSFLFFGVARGVDGGMDLAQELPTEMSLGISTLPSERREPSGAASRALLDRIRAVQRKQFRVWAASSAGLFIAAIVVGLAVAMFIDWELDLGLGARGVILAVLGLGWLVLGVILVRRIRLLPDTERVAFLVERFDRRFDGRLISALQLMRTEENRANHLVQALVLETEELARPVRFPRAVRTDQLQQISAITGLLLLAAGLAYLSSGTTVRDLLRRAFLDNIPVPRRTQVVEAGGDRVVGRGNSVVLGARAQGVIPRAGRAILRYGSARTQSLVLAGEPGRRGRFARQLDNVTESFSYQIRLNDGLSPEWHVKVVPLPTTTRLEAEQVFPSYTGLPPLRRTLGDLGLLAGSTLRLRATANKPLKTASVRLVGLDQNLPMQIERGTELSAEFAIPTNRLTGFSLQLLDQEGVTSKDSAVYRIDIIVDRAPVVQVIHPQRKEELITSGAVLLVAFEATDDFALAKAVLRYQSETLPAPSSRTIELDLGNRPIKSLRRRYEWKMAAFQPPLAEGTVVEYWIEVQDNNSDTGPGRGTSEHFLARVVSENEKRADLLNRVDDALGSIDEIALDQEKLNRNLGTLILERNQ